MGECKGSGSSLTFNRSVRIVGRDERLSSSAGLLLVRELDERWAIVSRLAERLADPRRASRVTWTLSTQLRRRVFALVTGFSSQRDAASLAGDPIVRLTTSDRRGSTPLLDSAEISQPTLARMHRMLGREENQRALSDSLFELGWRVIRNAAKASEGAHTIDVDSMPIMSHGQQPGSVWNAYYGGRCFHPLMGLHGETGTMLAAQLRPGNVQSAEDARSFVLDLVERFEQQIGGPVTVRGDAGFANGQLLTALEERGTRYIFHFGLNSILKRMAAPYLKLPRVRSSEPRESVYSLTYPGSRRSPVERRVILVVQETPGELYPHYFFLVTNDHRSKPETILERYRQRGTSESRFGELKSRLDPKLSCTSNKGDAAREDAWRANASTFLLYLIADGLLHALRWISKKELSSDGESLPRLQRVQRLLIDVAARVTRSARRIHVQVAESASDAWVRLLSRIGRLSPVT
jgi:Transposase DDE domain group 1